MTKSDAVGFADTAPRWWSMASQWLGWRPAEFWQATPIELRSALSEPEGAASGAGPSRQTIENMLERDKDG